MSTGQLRRCIVGRSLIHNPGAFVLDEPTTGLDIKARASFLNTIQRLAKNVPVILITHDVSEIFPEITHAALMYNGTLYKTGLINDVLTSENLSIIFDTDIEVNAKEGRYSVRLL